MFLIMVVYSVDGVLDPAKLPLSALEDLLNAATDNAVAKGQSFRSPEDARRCFVHLADGTTAEAARAVVGSVLGGGVQRGGG